MPWEERTANQMRKEFVERVLAHEKCKSALCREYGISRPTGDKWIARYLAGESLEDQKRAPHRIPGKTPDESVRPKFERFWRTKDIRSFQVRAQ